jgi:hypothetical protein
MKRLTGLLRRLLLKVPAFKSFWVIRGWAVSGFRVPAPHQVKMAVLERHAFSAPWVETGTFLGDTTLWLAKRYPAVVSLEPQEKLFANARRRLEVEGNVRLLNLASEDGLETAIEISESPLLNFWLDGHYSSGETHEGVRDTPAITELQTISKYLKSDRLTGVAVFVDDVRLFAVQHRERPSAEDRDGYPRLFLLCSWAENQGLAWTIEHDIFIAKSVVSR